MTKAIRVCLVGIGRIGQVHLKTLRRNPRVILVAVVDADLPKAQEAAATAAPPAHAFATLEEALTQAEFQAVVICSPTLFHPAHVKASLLAEKSVFCEKPLSLDLKEIDELYTLAASKNVPLLTGYHRRHDPNFAAARDTAHRSLGKLQVVRSTSRDNPVPAIAFLKTSGGIIHDCGSHDIDMVRWVLQEDPVEIYAMASCFNPDIKAINDFDTVIIQLRFASGALATIDLARQAVYGYDQRLEILGPNGMVQAENKKPTTVIHASVAGFVADPSCYSFPTRYIEAYTQEIEHFLDILSHGKTPILSHEDVRKTAIIADAANESLVNGKPVHIVYPPVLVQ